MPISGAQIRAARRAKGLTQAQLAQKAALSQGYLSMIERGEAAPAAALAALAKVLRIVEERPSDVAEASILVQEGPRLIPFAAPRLLPLQVHVQVVPERSGDGVLVLALDDRSVLIAAIDVTGHGPSRYPVTTYLLGWLSGRVRTGGAPRVQALAVELTAEMQRTELAAAFFLAILQRWNVSHDCTYEAVADGYPAPLLLQGAPPRSLPSAIPTEPTSTGRVEFVPHVIGNLEAPWRLAIASDGALGRLGAGDEADGMRALRRWQLSPHLHEIPASGPGSPLVDDQTLLTIAYDGWDEEWVFDAGDVGAAERVLRVLDARARPMIGAPERLLNAVAEAVVNVRTHAYRAANGKVRIRLRIQPQRCTVEIADEGRGIRPSEIATEGRGLAVMRALVASCDVVLNGANGTAITLTAKLEGT